MSHLSLFLIAVCLHRVVFFCLLPALPFLFSKLDRLLSAVGTEVNTPLMLGFILIWLGGKHFSSCITPTPLPPLLPSFLLSQSVFVFVFKSLIPTHHVFPFAETEYPVGHRVERNPLAQAPVLSPRAGFVEKKVQHTFHVVPCPRSPTFNKPKGEHDPIFL